MIRQLEILQYAGVKNRTVTFEKGLNVILGENEAGKSTLVEALYSVLFMPIKIGNRKSVDKIFMDNAFPYGTSDYAEVKVTFEYLGDRYDLHKLWHVKKPIIQLMRNDEKVINEAEIEALLSAYLKHTEGTYKHLFFSKQDRFKQIFEVIKDNPEIYQSVGDLLKNAGYELDGLSVEDFKGRLNKALKELISNWELQHNRPADGRGIDNPHKKNIGKVLEAHYEGEQALKGAREIEAIELELETLQEKIRMLSTQKMHLSKDIEFNKTLESDVRKRQQIEFAIERLEEKKKQRLEINKEWPEVLAKKEIYLESFNSTEAQANEIKSQLQMQLDYEAHMEKMDTYKKRSTINERLIGLDDAIKALHQFEDKSLQELNQISEIIAQSRLVIKSAELGGQLLKSTQAVVIVDHSGNQSVVKEGESWTTDAYMKIVGKDNLEIEIKSKQIDFDAIKRELEENEVKLKWMLDALNVDHISEAQLKLKQKKELVSERNIAQKQLEMLPEVGDVDALLKNNEKFQHHDEIPKNFLERQLQMILDTINTKKSELMKLELKIESWEKTFGSHDAVALELGGIMAEVNTHANALKGLKEMPPQFDTADDFFHHLEALRNQMETTQESLRIMEVEAERLLGMLPDKSSIELLTSSKEKFEERDRYIQKANRLQNILNTLERVMDSSVPKKSTLESNFIDNLRIMTGDKYGDLDFDEALNLRVVKSESALPVSMLSSGTLDGVALAFRLSIMETVDAEGSSIAVFDDCLINMDDSRRQYAIQAIKRHADTRQTLYLTCHENLAEVFGGNLIKI